MTQRYDPTQVTLPLDVAQSAAYVGCATAIPGLVSGAFYGTIRTKTPVLFSIASGIQCFTIGTTFWGIRTSLLNHAGLQNWWNITRGNPLEPRNDLNPTPSDKVQASTLAGALTGFSLGFLFRGPRNVIPGTIMFTLFGWSGQRGYNYLDQRNSRELQEAAQLKAQGEKPRDNLLQRLVKSKYSPMSVLTDEEYQTMLEERLLKVEAEIAIIDERMAEVRKNMVEEQAKRKIAEQQAAAQGKK